jgi:hypothetical protein
VPAGAELDALAKAQAARDVTGHEDLVDAVHDVAKMMDCRTGPADEYNVVARLPDV